MMLRPQDTATRDTKCLSGMWDFAFDAEDRGQTEKWFTRPLPTCTEMAVPASYQDLSTDPAARDHVGPVWYQREVRIPRGWTDDRVVVHFESATHAATVWVNDVEVVRHVGGYLPFEADITDHVCAGKKMSAHGSCR
ncbi:beta-glucuronidase [Cutibacterium acnes JCM 18916]|nr:beta-glucuronidase [Cutibacterium acnes JCM 18916]GAE76380.1 beta-glucuronidase [Cutibacterium acnes JCM 18918]